MALIPGEGSTVPNIASAIGSGIDITTSAGGVDFLSAFLQAGTNVTLVPSISNKSITINAAPGGGGIISVQAEAGAGVYTNTDISGHVAITSALVAGTGIQLVQSGVNETVTINNTGAQPTSVNGSGITVGAGGQISANLLAGTGIGIASSGINTSKTISNTGVTSLTAGSGISLSGSTGAVTISATAPQSFPIWRQLFNNPSNFFSSNSYIIFQNIASFPTNNPTPLYIQVTFQNVTYAGQFGDPYVAVSGGNIGNALLTPTNIQWMATYQNPPGNPNPYCFTYFYMIPPNNAGASINITALGASISCNASSAGYIFY